MRCNLCGQVFTAEAPEGVGEKKYDETAAAMIAQLKYGSGLPFYRLEELERHLGIPLPAATQWEIVEETAEVHQAGARRADSARRRKAKWCTTTIPACGCCAGPRCGRPSGPACSPAGSLRRSQGRQIALFFTGRKHAGENLAEVLKQRPAELPPPIQMCDALSRNVPKLPAGVEMLLANCLAHGRRQFVEVTLEFSRAMPVRAGDSGRGLRLR